MGREEGTRNQINSNENRKEEPGKIRTCVENGRRQKSTEGDVWMDETTRKGEEREEKAQMHTEILEQVSQRSGMGPTVPGTKSSGQERMENDEEKDGTNKAMGRNTKERLQRARKRTSHKNPRKN